MLPVRLVRSPDYEHHERGKIRSRQDARHPQGGRADASVASHVSLKAVVASQRRAPASLDVPVLSS